MYPQDLVAGKSALVNDEGLDVLFRKARTLKGWLRRPVGDEMLHALYELWKWGPTSTNCQPARFVFVRSASGKERLKGALTPGNVEKTMTAPVTVIVGYDLKFYQHMRRLNPARDLTGTFEKDPAYAASTAFRNGSLQGAYFMLAARALGLDCGPMSGFNNDAVDQEFFAGTDIKSNFLCNVGYGDWHTVTPRGPRLTFEEACSFA